MKSVHAIADDNVNDVIVVIVRSYDAQASAFSFQKREKEQN